MQDELRNATEDEDLPQATSGHLIEGFSGNGVRESRVGQMDKLLNEHAQEGKHAHAPVLDLRFLQPLDVHELREGKGVKACVADHILREGGGLGEERHGRRLCGRGRGGRFFSHPQCGAGDGGCAEGSAADGGAGERSRASGDSEARDKSGGYHGDGGRLGRKRGMSKLGRRLG